MAGAGGAGDDGPGTEGEQEGGGDGGREAGQRGCARPALALRAVVAAPPAPSSVHGVSCSTGRGAPATDRGSPSRESRKPAGVVPGACACWVSARMTVADRGCGITQIAPFRRRGAPPATPAVATRRRPPSRLARPRVPVGRPD